MKLKIKRLVFQAVVGLALLGLLLAILGLLGGFECDELNLHPTFYVSKEDMERSLRAQQGRIDRADGEQRIIVHIDPDASNRYKLHMRAYNSMHFDQSFRINMRINLSVLQDGVWRHVEMPFIQRENYVVQSLGYVDTYIDWRDYFSYLCRGEYVVGMSWDVRPVAFTESFGQELFPKSFWFEVR